MARRVVRLAEARVVVQVTFTRFFLLPREVPGEELRVEVDPEIRWVSVADGTRTLPDLEDRAAKFLPQQNLILANGDFRVFTDMIDRWCKQYNHVAGARETILDVVREWFEQQMIETVMGVQALSDARQWTVQDVEKTWSEEALTAATPGQFSGERKTMSHVWFFGGCR